jgi:hypothetical protein
MLSYCEYNEYLERTANTLLKYELTTSHSIMKIPGPGALDKPISSVYISKKTACWRRGRRSGAWHYLIKNTCPIKNLNISLITK